MRQAFFSAAILCILYYIVILCYTKNKKATFAWFWLMLGILQMLLGIVAPSMPKGAIVVLQLLFGVFLLLFFAVEIVILSGMLTMPLKELPVIIVLGACIRGVKITGSLKRRLDKAIVYLHDNPETMVIVSGGKGRGEDVTEALAMRRYLMECEVPEERIVMEDKSRTTEENLKFSKELLKRGEKKVGIVTNNFHIYRAVKLAKSIGYKKVYGITAGCDPILFLNYMVREFFAVLWLYIKLARKSRKEQIDK